MNEDLKLGQRVKLVLDKDGSYEVTSNITDTRRGMFYQTIVLRAPVTEERKDK